tara:strand:+ start:1030 stop:4713 length:3684 start_codon:yes stop_codon:yes gene_type:complete
MINKRIFGSPIPINVQKKLEARQLAAIGDKKPFEEIDSNYKDDRASRYKYNELLASNFNMEADLSSRTPFARMWTGISLVNERDFEKKETEDSTNSSISDSIEKSKQQDNELERLNSLIQQIKYKELERTIYIVGTNNLSTLDNSMDPNNSQQNQNYSAVFPPEHQVEGDNNKFMKPAAGITKVSSETEGIMGSIKKTTVDFTVHNFHDYDKIFSKFFLRPGAQVFVDFGWDALKDSSGNPIKLYDPHEILNLKSVDNQYSNDEKVEHKLYGQIERDSIDEDGFVTRCNGDVETLVGIVTDYDSKIQQNGSVECSLTITSKNSALIQYPKHTGTNVEAANQKFAFDLDNLIFYEQAYKLGSGTDQSRLRSGVEKVTNAGTSVDDELSFDNFLTSVKFKSFGSKSFVPTAMAQVSGLFVVGDEDAEDSYIQWGLLEDRIFNKYFGHGDDATSVSEDKEGKFTVRLDSSDGFTAFEKGFLYKQAQTDSAPNFLIPYNWDISYSNPRDASGKQKSGMKDGERVLEFLQGGKENYKQYGDEAEFKKKVDEDKENFNKFVSEKYSDAANSGTTRPVKVFTENGLVTKYDKEVKRVPIREIFINIEIVKDAFINDNNKNFRDVVNEILDAVNEDSYGLWDWKLVGEENILKINDMNFSNVAIGTKDERKKEFDKIFRFEVMSKNSIVTDYSVSFEMPDGDIGSMYAIQAMTGTPAKMDPITSIIESHSALQTICNKYNADLKKVGFRYLPDLGAYNALNQASQRFTQEQKLKYYNDISTEFKDKNSGNGSYWSGIGTVNPNVEWSPAVEEKSKKQSGVFNDDIDFNGEARMELARKREREAGKTVAGNIDDYYEYKITGEFVTEDHYKAIPLPMKLELTIYGISSLKPGDTFRVDYLPELYMEYVYFQVINVSHDVGAGGWYTTLETQFRVSPHRYEDSNMFKAPATGDDEEKENLKNLLNEANISGDDADFLVKSISISENKQKAEPPPVVLDPMMLKGGELLSEDIDDSRAYMWDNEATAFSTLYGKRYESYWQRVNDSGPLRIYSNGDWDWDYVKGSGKLPTIKGASISKWSADGKSSTGYTRDVITNRDFKSLRFFMTDLQQEDDKKYTYFDRLFSFKIVSDLPIFIPNPLYYWSDENNRYNGYGNFRCTWGRNGGKTTYVGGVYWPGEKCYLVINSGAPSKWWGVFPTNSASRTKLSDVNYEAFDPRWSEYEWSDEGPSGGGTPDQYD